MKVKSSLIDSSPLNIDQCFLQPTFEESEEIVEEGSRDTPFSFQPKDKPEMKEIEEFDSLMQGRKAGRFENQYSSEKSPGRNSRVILKRDSVSALIDGETPMKKLFQENIQVQQRIDQIYAESPMLDVRYQTETVLTTERLPSQDPGKFELDVPGVKNESTYTFSAVKNDGQRESDNFASPRMSSYMDETKDKEDKQSLDDGKFSIISPKRKEQTANMPNLLVENTQSPSVIRELDMDSGIEGFDSLIRSDIRGSNSQLNEDMGYKLEDSAPLYKQVKPKGIEDTQEFNFLDFSMDYLKDSMVDKRDFNTAKNEFVNKYYNLGLSSFLAGKKEITEKERQVIKSYFVLYLKVKYSLVVTLYR